MCGNKHVACTQFPDLLQSTQRQEQTRKNAPKPLNESIHKYEQEYHAENTCTAMGVVAESTRGGRCNSYTGHRTPSMNTPVKEGGGWEKNLWMFVPEMHEGL